MGALPKCIGTITRKSQRAGMSVRVESDLNLVKQGGKGVIECIPHGYRLWSREDNCLSATVRSDNRVARVVLFDELPRPLHAGSINYRVEQVRAKVRWIGAHRLLESLIDRQHPAVRKKGILPNEKSDQMK